MSKNNDLLTAGKPASALLSHPITGLPNKLLLQDRLEQAIIFAQHYGMLLSVVIIEFTPLETTAEQTEWLIPLAKQLAGCLQSKDTLAHIEDNKFIILLPCLFNEQAYQPIAENITKTLNAFAADKFHFTMGISFYPKDSTDATLLIDKAEAALAYAKQTGNNKQPIYVKSPLNAENIPEQSLRKDLTSALENKEFLLEYQPIYNIITHQIIGAETLLRWKHPKHGLINPNIFIPLAETEKLLIPISDWVMATACAQNKSWQDAGLPAITITINLTDQHFKQDNFMESLIKILKQTRMPGKYLELELTENTILENSRDIVKLMLELQKLDIQITLNDFDARFTNLNYLIQLPIHKIKIDPAFIKKIPADSDNAAIVRAAIETAHSLKMQVLAVGVETKEQVDFLISNKADEIQGYYFNQPVDAKAFAQLLRTNP